MEKLEYHDFEVSFALEKDLSIEKFSLINDLFTQLNENLNLSDYSDSITSLLVVYQCFHPGNDFVKVNEKAQLKRKTKVLELYLTLDYFLVIVECNEGVFKVLAKSLLSGINRLINLKGFHKEKLLTDISALIPL